MLQRPKSQSFGQRPARETAFLRKVADNKIGVPVSKTVKRTLAKTTRNSELEEEPQVKRAWGAMPPKVPRLKNEVAIQKLKSLTS